MNTPQASSPRRIAAWAGALLLTLLMAPSMASATGLLLPSDEALPPLAIKSHRVKIDITDQASVTRVEQVFVNHTDRQLEATFYFPVPLGATVSDFSLWINGRKTPGAVLEKNKARQIYERIVRRVQDPGLVEYMDGSIFQARIFPVPAKGEQKVEIAYASILEQIGPMRRVLYPLKTGRTAARLMQDFTVEAHIDSRAPLAAIYSPTHRVDVHRKSDHKAIVGVEQTAADLEEDFLLYIGTTDDDVGLSLLTHDPDGPGGKDGTFLMVLAPTFGDEDEELPPKAVTFVVDTSGSMAGDKIVQARKALSACLGKLRPEDHFNVVSFSTSVRKLFPKPVQASADRIKEGMAFAQNLEAAGGTAISDALDEALAGKPAGQMPHFVLFMTDGRPTVGTIEPNEILKEIRSKNGHKARVFTFGLGYDVNPILLDSVSREHRGYSDYVRPSEDIKVKVTGLYNKLAYPVMTDLQIDYGTHHVHDVYPRQLPDLFQGGQVVVMGRYSKELPTTIALSGTRGGQALTVTFDEIAPGQGDANKDAAHAFIPKLWATRKVGYLLEEIRANGELKELKDEVVRLATTYGLVTPYTSYLAVDDSEFEGQPAPRPGVVQGGAGDFKEYEFEDSLVEGNLRRDSRNYGARWQRDEALKKKGNMDADTGQGAVDASLATNDLKQVQSNEEANNNKTRWIDGRLFVLNTDGVWEEKGTEGRKARKIEYLSDEYFDLIEDRPDMKRRMSVGPNVQFEMDDEVLLVE